MNTHRHFSMPAALLLAVTAVSATAVAAQTSTTTPRPVSGASGQPVVRSLGHPSADTAAVFANLLATMNRDEISAAKLAMAKATRPDIRAYAKKMATQHAAALDSLKANADAGSWVIKDSTGRSPAAAMRADSAGVSEMSTPSLPMAMMAASLHGANRADLHTLQTSSGAAFDKAYIDSQIRGHRALLKVITGLSTGNEKLQKQIIDTQHANEIHLDQARKMQKLMSPTSMK
jgi:predicted outer membrane protein